MPAYYFLYPITATFSPITEYNFQFALPWCIHTVMINPIMPFVEDVVVVYPEMTLCLPNVSENHYAFLH